jgi:RNA polymerase sigma-70 factor (ECF subfamily)
MGRPIDRNDVDRLVVEHLPAASRFALRLTGDEHAAEDVVQEALCRALRQWRSFRGESSFRTWLLQIVLNADRDRRRRRRDAIPLGGVETASLSASPPALAAAAEVDAAVRTAIERLPPRQREVALLTWGEGLSPAEVARVLEISEANVYTNLHLARKQIAAGIGVDFAAQDVP